MPVGEQCPGSAHDGHLAGRAAKERRRAATRNGGGRVRMPAKNKCAPFVDMRKRGRRLAVRPSKDPLGEVWRAEALQMKSEPGDMRGGFGSLASKVSLRVFPAAPQAQGKRVLATKARAAGLCRQAKDRRQHVVDGLTVVRAAPNSPFCADTGFVRCPTPTRYTHSPSARRPA